MNFYTVYRAHDLKFKIYGAMMLGQTRVALDTAGQLTAGLPEELLRVQVPPMAAWLEGFAPMKLHALVRFGRWQEIIDTPLPQDQDLFCVTTAMTHYAKGVALASSGRVAEAGQQWRLFQRAVSRVPAARTAVNKTCLDILAVAASSRPRSAR